MVGHKKYVSTFSLIFFGQNTGNCFPPKSRNVTISYVILNFLVYFSCPMILVKQHHGTLEEDNDTSVLPSR